MVGAFDRITFVAPDADETPAMTAAAPMALFLRNSRRVAELAFFVLFPLFFMIPLLGMVNGGPYGYDRPARKWPSLPVLRQEAMPQILSNITCVRVIW